MGTSFNVTPSPSGPGGFSPGGGGGGGGSTTTTTTTTTTTGAGGTSSGTPNTPASLFLEFINTADRIKTVRAGDTGTVNFIMYRTPAATSPFQADIVVDKIEKITSAGVQSNISGVTTSFVNTPVVQSGESKIQSVLNFNTLGTLSPGTYRLYIRAFVPVAVDTRSTANLPQTTFECKANDECKDTRYYCDTSIALGFTNGDLTDPYYICRLSPQQRADTTFTPTSTLTVDIVVTPPPAQLTATSPVTVFVNNTATTSVTVTRNGETADLLVKAVNLPTGVTAAELDLSSNSSSGTLTFAAANNATINESGVDIQLKLVSKSDPNRLIATAPVRLIIRGTVCANGSCTQDSNCTNGRICQNGCCVDAPPPPDNTTVIFSPVPNTALNFTYTKNSNVYPPATTITARNPSTTKTFTVIMRAVRDGTVVSAGQNPAIVITPVQLILQAGQTGSFSVQAVGQYLQSLNVGTYQNIRLEASISDTI